MINIPVPTVSVLMNYFSKSVPRTTCIRITAGGGRQAGLKYRFSGLVAHPPVWTLGGWNLRIHIIKSPEGLSCSLEFGMNSKDKLHGIDCWVVIIMTIDGVLTRYQRHWEQHLTLKQYCYFPYVSKFNRNLRLSNLAEFSWSVYHRTSYLCPCSCSACGLLS